MECYGDDSNCYGDIDGNIDGNIDGDEGNILLDMVELMVCEWYIIWNTIHL